VQKVIVVVLGLLVGFGAFAKSPHSDYNVVYDLANDWMIYDRDVESYVPYSRVGDSDLQMFSLEVDLLNFPHAFLLIKTPESPTSIFIDNALKAVTKKSDWLVYDIQKLKKEYRSGKAVFSFLTVEDPSEFIVFVGFPNQGKTEVTEKGQAKEVVRLLPRGFSRNNSGIAIAFIIGLIITSFVSNNYFRVYAKYYSIQEVFSTKVKEDLFMIGKPLDRPSLLFVILNSIVIGFVILLLQTKDYRLLENSLVYQSGNGPGLFVVNFFRVSLVVFISYIIKFFYISIIGKLFNIGNATDSHYFKAIQSTLFFYSLVFLVLLGMHNFYIPLPQTIDSYILIGLTIFYTVRSVLIYFTINRDTNIKFLYLFSYLCISEVLPLIVGARFLF
jgi:hypothetical protein